MSKEVKIKLTDEQKAKIKKGTGQDLSEIRVSAVGANPTAATKQASAKKAMRAHFTRAHIATARKMETARKMFGPRLGHITTARKLEP